MDFDIDLKSLTADDYKFVQNAVKNYDSMKPMILEGDQYRLVSPYEGNHCAINYVSKDKQYCGDYLMKVGLNVFSQTDGTSHVLVLE
ncbi:GH36 C-terminal domain-containing protein [Segatella copri]|uniref:GH36 C-terminal domain-containing protein n=1 Tax=Segatella copri TaxID=165179 RepID=UPI002114B509|nr:GH36 C-terminal domain-containing protein [Segatella copri]